MNKKFRKTLAKEPRIKGKSTNTTEQSENGNAKLSLPSPPLWENFFSAIYELKVNDNLIRANIVRLLSLNYYN